MRRRNPSLALTATLLFAALAAPAVCQEKDKPADEVAKAKPTFVFEKNGKIVLDTGPSGSFDSTHAKYPSVLRVGDKWWMWYNGRTDDAFTGSVGLATSKDGLTWTKQNNGAPVLERGPPGTFDSTKVDHPAVLFFDDKFHMWYTAGDAGSRYTIGYATSPDGIKWKRENGGKPVLTPGRKGSFDDTVVLHPSVARDDDGVLHIWYVGVGPQEGFRVGHATSQDGINWERQNDGKPVIVPTQVEGYPKEAYTYNVMVLYHNKTFHMWYSATMIMKMGGTIFKKRDYQSTNGLRYAWSKNGTNWKLDKAYTILNGPKGSIDAYACFACYVVPRVEGLWMYYSAGSWYQRYKIALATSEAHLP